MFRKFSIAILECLIVTCLIFIYSCYPDICFFQSTKHMLAFLKPKLYSESLHRPYILICQEVKQNWVSFMLSKAMFYDQIPRHFFLSDSIWAFFFNKTWCNYSEQILSPNVKKCQIGKTVSDIKPDKIEFLSQNCRKFELDLSFTKNYRATIPIIKILFNMIIKYLSRLNHTKVKTRRLLWW